MKLFLFLKYYFSLSFFFRQNFAIKTATESCNLMRDFGFGSSYIFFIHSNFTFGPDVSCIHLDFWILFVWLCEKQRISWQNSVLYLKHHLFLISLLSYTKLCYLCFFLSVPQVHYWDRIYKTQHGPNGSADPTVLLHDCWWSDVFCYRSGVFLFTGKRTSPLE